MLKTEDNIHQNKIITHRFSLFNNFHQIKCAVFSRKGGCSEEAYSSLNLSFKAGDNPEMVALNRIRLAQFINLNPDNLFFPDQCHTDNIRLIDEHTTTANLIETDALITGKKGLAIGVLAADCVPVVLFDPIKNVIAVAHAGWKGTVKRIVCKVVAQMVKDFYCQPEGIKVGIGPAISQKNYEVGTDVIKEILKLGPDYKQFLIQEKSNNKAFVDLQGINKQLLLEVGLTESNIEIAPICTFDNPNLFFSARRDGFNSGRFGTVIVLL